MDSTSILEYKCPCCNAGLHFQVGTQKLKCEYCDNTFDLETVKAYNDSQIPLSPDTLTWEQPDTRRWGDDEQASVCAFQCPACGGEILAEDTAAAMFCPYCDNPTILPSRVGGALKPDGIIPFQKTKEDAQKAFLDLCKGKPLLPNGFVSEHRLEHITGIYVPFWLYDCDAQFNGSYRATRMHCWSDSHYNYTRTDHFLLRRDGSAQFINIPMDGSSKMDDTFMESIEPYNFQKLQPFDMGYLSGFLADKHDVAPESGEGRIKERVQRSVEQELQSTFLGYSSVLPVNNHLDIHHSKAKYVLLPVWLLNTNYNGKIYTFAMNGQTGKITGSLPVCSRKSAVWFAGIFAAVTILATLFQLL